MSIDKRATLADAPAVLNTNDKAMWVLGYNAAAEALGDEVAAACKAIGLMNIEREALLRTLGVASPNERQPALPRDLDRTVPRSEGVVAGVGVDDGYCHDCEDVRHCGTIRKCLYGKRTTVGVTAPYTSP